MTAAGNEGREFVVHYGGGDLLPLHPTPPGEGVLVAFHEGGANCPTCIALRAPLVDRRQQVREAYYDNGGAPDARGEYAPIEMAITTATTVKMTHDIVRAFIEAPDDPEEITGPLIAAFRAAGFEVVE